MTDPTVTQPEPLTVQGGEIRKPSKQPNVWMRFLYATVGCAMIYFTLHNAIMGFINRVAQTSYKATATTYTSTEPSVSIAILVFMLNYAGLVLGCALLTESMSRRPAIIPIIAAGIVMFVPAFLVGSLGLIGVAGKIAAPDYMNPGDWLAKNYQVSDENLPIESGIFYEVSKSGAKYKFQYTAVGDTKSIKELPNTG